MTEEEIKTLYSKIERLDIDEIKAIIDAESQILSGEIGFNFIGALLGNLFSAGSVYSNLEKACKKTWDQNNNRIQSIIQNNPKSSKAIMDIVCLLAPTIAQQYTGFSGMAIVGTLTIMCKHNLGL